MSDLELGWKWMSSSSVPHWTLGDISFYYSHPKTLARWKYIIKTKVAGSELKSNYLRLWVCAVALNVITGALPSKLQTSWFHKGDFLESSVGNRGHSVSQGDTIQNLELVRGHEATVRISSKGKIHTCSYLFTIHMHMCLWCMFTCLYKMCEYMHVCGFLNECCSVCVHVCGGQRNSLLRCWSFSSHLILVRSPTHQTIWPLSFQRLSRLPSYLTSATLTFQTHATVPGFPWVLGTWAQVLKLIHNKPSTYQAVCPSQDSWAYVKQMKTWTV